MYKCKKYSFKIPQVSNLKGWSVPRWNNLKKSAHYWGVYGWQAQDTYIIYTWMLLNPLAKEVLSDAEKAKYCDFG